MDIRLQPIAISPHEWWPPSASLNTIEVCHNRKARAGHPSARWAEQPSTSPCHEKGGGGGGGGVPAELHIRITSVLHLYYVVAYMPGRPHAAPPGGGGEGQHAVALIVEALDG